MRSMLSLCHVSVTMLILLSFSSCAHQASEKISIPSALGGSTSFMVEAQNQENVPPKDLSRPLSEIRRPQIVVKKSDRKLQVFDGEVVVREYKIGLGWSPQGDKMRAKDGKTPEGHFYICRKNAGSQFHKSLWISYPGMEQAKRALDKGWIGEDTFASIASAQKSKTLPPMGTRLGGMVAIHGGGGNRDWTFGCMALDNRDMDDLFRVASQGTPVTIMP